VSWRSKSLNNNTVKTDKIRSEATLNCELRIANCALLVKVVAEPKENIPLTNHLHGDKIIRDKRKFNIPFKALRKRVFPVTDFTESLAVGCKQGRFREKSTTFERVPK